MPTTKEEEEWVVRPGVALGLAVILSGATVAPVFLVGTLAGRMSADVALGPGDVGLATSLFFTSVGATAALFGRIVDRLEIRKLIVASMALGGGSLLLLGLLAESVATLLIFLGIGGAANGIAGPVGSRLLAKAITSGRLGIAFGVKQASLPIATMVAGSAVPLVARWMGWQTLFALLGVAMLLLAPLLRPGYGPRGEGVAASKSGFPAIKEQRLWIVGLAMAIGVGTLSSLVVLLVDAGGQVGLGDELVGYLITGASLVGLVLRIGLGWTADRGVDYGRWLVLFAMLAAAVGCLGLSTGTVLGVVFGGGMALSLGWAWPGMVLYLAVRSGVENAGRSASVVQAGAAIGGAVLPAVIGNLVEYQGHGVAWFSAGVGVGLSAVLAFFALRPVRRPCEGRAGFVT